MSETPELPPLPEPFKVLLGPLPVFTAQQMREQWDAGRRAGLDATLDWIELARRMSEAFPEHGYAIMETVHGWLFRAAQGRERTATSLMPPGPTIADAIREAREDGRRAGLEEAAKLAEDHASDEAPHTPNDTYIDGYRDASNEITWAIRGKAGECGGTGRAKP